MPNSPEAALPTTVTISGEPAVFSTSTAPDQLEKLYGHIAQSLGELAVYQAIVKCQENTGVIMHDEFHYMPSILNSRGTFLPLYEFVEVLDGIVDYHEISGELDLTYTQIDGAMTFLRRLAMINPQGFSPDQYELELDAQDPELLEALRQGISSQEGLRVLDAG